MPFTETSVSYQQVKPLILYFIPKFEITGDMYTQQLVRDSIAALVSGVIYSNRGQVRRRSFSHLNLQGSDRSEDWTLTDVARGVAFIWKGLSRGALERALYLTRAGATLSDFRRSLEVEGESPLLYERTTDPRLRMRLQIRRSLHPHLLVHVYKILVGLT